MQQQTHPRSRVRIDVTYRRRATTRDRSETATVKFRAAQRRRRQIMRGTRPPHIRRTGSRSTIFRPWPGQFPTRRGFVSTSIRLQAAQVCGPDERTPYRGNRPRPHPLRPQVHPAGRSNSRPSGRLKEHVQKGLVTNAWRTSLGQSSSESCWAKTEILGRRRAARRHRFRVP